MRPWNHPICSICGDGRVWVGDPDSEEVRNRVCPRCDVHSEEDEEAVQRALASGSSEAPR